MTGRRMREGFAVGWFAGAAGVALTHLAGCSPVDLITDTDTSTDSRDAAVTSVAESTAELARTTREVPVDSEPGPQPTAQSSDHETTMVSTTESMGGGVTTEVATSIASSTELPGASSAEPNPTSEEPELPLDPECLATNVDPIPPGIAGFATVAGYDLTQTVGGLSGTSVYVGSERSLRAALASSEPRIVVVCGEIALGSRLQIGSNKTLVGLGPSSILRGGLDIRGEEGNYVSNVIVANLVLDPSAVVLEDVYGALTGVQIEFAHHVWLDHLEIYNAPQGLVDVVSGSDLVTLSWNKFYFTQETPDLERRFGVRIGDVTDASVLARDGGKLRVTLHHNWFGEFIRQRMPRVAYGQAHVINNYYSTTGNDTTIWGLSRYAQVLVEGNYFQRTHRPHDIPPTSEVPNDELAQVVASGNVYYETTGARKTQGSAFEPPYALARDSVVWLPSLVPWGAGPHASFDPKPPWSDAGVVAPDVGIDGGLLASDAGSSESLPNVADASEQGSGAAEDASLDAAFTTGDAP